MNYLQHSPDDIAAMLKTIGVPSTAALFEQIPPAARFNRALNIAGFETETELRAAMEGIAARNANTDTTPCFLGGGAYNHYVPTVIDHMILRGEWLTSYTPYQPETSQGNLQALFEYQSMVCALTGMHASNSSLYDGSSAFIESALMALRLTKNRDRIVVLGTVHPEYLQILRTYMINLDVTVHEIAPRDGVVPAADVKAALDDRTAAVMAQSPNFMGCLEDLEGIGRAAKAAGAIYTVHANNPVTLAILKPPAEFGADIVTAEGQPLGNELQGGGPYFGIFTTREEHLRQLPGRLIGQTADRNGKRGFVLTMQTREQHIRRQKATSNVCTSANLCALRGAIYVSLMGPDGLRDVARVCYEKAHALAERVAAIPGYSLAHAQPFFHEFTVTAPKPAAAILKKVRDEHRILGGIDLGRYDARRANQILIAVTERNSNADIDALVAALQAAAR